MSLLDIIRELKAYSAETDNQVGNSYISLSAKKKFIDIWKNDARNAILVSGQIRISNQGPPTYAVTDELLLKCTKAIELYREYDRLAGFLLNHITERNILNKIGAEKADASLTQVEIERVKAQLETKPELSADISVLKMMLESKSARSVDGHVGPFKQITRTQDRWAPALSKFIATLAADAYPNSITTFLMNQPDLARDIIEINPSDLITSIMPSGEASTRKLVLSLLAKRFVILTGASGTGKTQLAEGLARHYAERDASRFAVVAVGADWTDNRHVLGFVNHLRQVTIEGADKPIFQSTPVLDLLLRAANDRENKPYFLVLDEMNLSHVERYFADFLSAMERREGTLQLHSSQGSLPRSENDTLGVPQEIPFPRNLFVIGTVNVDETTYMFSPKVLDRANVIEFRMKDTDLQNFLNGDGSLPDYGSATSEEAQDFFRLASSDALDDLPELVKAAAGEQLQKIFAIMEGCRFEFGYRAAKEVMRFLKICRHLAEDKTAWDGGAWLTDMDTQILQKLMPRLHGGKARMVPLLTDLGYLCHGTEKPAGARLDTLESRQGTARFPRSFEKIRAMAKLLIEEQFVSFIC